MSARHAARLSWRCRRGMKELDLLLSAWLEAHYAHASEARRGQFEALLGLPDPELAAYLLAGQRPVLPDMAALVDLIRAAAPPANKKIM
ncbi:MAG: succinate dehydrogenase assembly factor 2 [Steroidobacteraceae bacterium]